MQVYCPCCEEKLSEDTETVLQQGKCPKCGGQLNVGDLSSDESVTGALAMTFAAGSKLAAPLDAEFKETPLDLNGLYKFRDIKLPAYVRERNWR